MNRICSHLFILFISVFIISETTGSCKDQSFSVLVYNVENLFDLDGISIFAEYDQSTEKNARPYHAGRFLTKINNHAEVIRAFNEGQGPDIVAIQEFEADFSKDPTFNLLQEQIKYEKFTVQQMLTENLNAEIKTLPPEFFLLKRLSELGLDDYKFYSPKHNEEWLKKYIAHRCVYLSRFEATSLNQHPIDEARDIFEATFNIEGHPFTIFNNHWKSGASSSRYEPTRVKNANTLKNILNERFKESPEADIILVGDFNSHHNQNLRMQNVETTAINGVLKSQSSEKALSTGNADLYNLWYELPQQQRGSEIWAGQWGTLMQIMISPGLLDCQDVRYKDQSFGVHRIPGLNYDPIKDEPISWINLGKGKGCSDHLPVYAFFEIPHQSKVQNSIVYGNEIEKEHIPVWVKDHSKEQSPLGNPERLENLTNDELLEYIGKPFEITAKKNENGILIGSATYSIYSPFREIRDVIKKMDIDHSFSFTGTFDIYRGELQFVIEDQEQFYP